MTANSLNQPKPEIKHICSIPGCGDKHHARGFCGMHYQRWRKHGDPLGGSIKYRTLEQAFETSVDKNSPNGCWLWMGLRLPYGYGRLNANGTTISAHRFSWELHNGPIPEGEGYHGTCVLHHCDNPPCVNPEHLFLGTVKDNYDDMVKKDRQFFRDGENNFNAKLKNNDIPHILADLRSQRKIAENYGVSRSTIRDIKNGKYWRSYQ